MPSNNGAPDYAATPKTDAQILNALKIVRDDYILSGRFMQKNWTDKDGVTVFVRSPDELEAYIDLYQSRVDAVTGTSSYMTWSYFYA